MTRVTFLDHSGFLVELPNVTLLFDWWKGELPALRPGVPLLVFSSHRHEDHFKPEIFALDANAFLLGSEYRNDLIAMSEKLTEVEVEHILVDPLAEYGEEKPHCFVANERVDPVAAEAFSRLTAFLKEKTAR